MTIKQATPEQAKEILKFLNSIFHEDSVNLYCSNLEKKLEDNSYSSWIFEKNNEIAGHFGITFLKEAAIFNMMAVNPEFRCQGLAKELLNSALGYSEKRDINHAIGYCVLQHPYSEKIHDDTFKPIGLMITQQNFLNNMDPLSNSKLLNGNLVLCKTFKKPSEKI